MKTSKFTWTILFLTLGACTTSLKVRDGKGSAAASDDGVKTLKAPPTAAEVKSVELPADKPVGEEVQREIDRLKGEVESAKYLAEQKEKELQTRITQLEIENEKLKADLAAALKGGGKTESTNPGDTAKLLWEQGQAALQKGDRERALDSFRTLAATYPKYEHAHSALVAQGMLYYADKNYKEAAFSFDGAMTKYKNKRNGISFVEFCLAASFHSRGDRNEAKLFFEEIVRKYPKSAAAFQAKSILAKKTKVPEDLFKAFPNWAELIR